MSPCGASLLSPLCLGLTVGGEVDPVRVTGRVGRSGAPSRGKGPWRSAEHRPPLGKWSGCHCGLPPGLGRLSAATRRRSGECLHLVTVREVLVLMVTARVLVMTLPPSACQSGSQWWGSGPPAPPIPSAWPLQGHPRLLPWARLLEGLRSVADCCCLLFSRNV